MAQVHVGFSVCVVSLAVSLVVGCGGSTGSDALLSIGRSSAGDESFASQRLANVSLDQAMEAAQQAFRQYYSIDRVDSAERTIYARPAEFREGTQGERVRDVLNRKANRRREIAELRLTSRGADVIAACRVQVQRLDTIERRAFAPQVGDDRPANNNPFAAEEGTTATQREDWVAVGRNRQAEQQVLSSLRERLNPTTAPAASQ